MRVFGISTVVLLSIVDLGWSQVDVPSSQNGNLPMYRPIVLGTGPDALINRIDTAGLIQQGQRDAAIMFSCFVKKTGKHDRCIPLPLLNQTRGVDPVDRSEEHTSELQ